MENTRKLPVRKNIRLQGYDYSRAGYYFITICVKDGYEMLGTIDVGEAQGRVLHCILSEYGYVVKQEIENISVVRKECLVEKFVIMPNHLHMIVKIVGDDGNRPVQTQIACPVQTDDDCVKYRADCHPPLQKSIPNMVQGLKGAVTRRVGFSLWQRSYHDHIIRDETEYQRIWQYIDENPEKWADDCYYKIPKKTLEKD